MEYQYWSTKYWKYKVHGLPGVRTEQGQLSGNTLDCRSRGCGFKSPPWQKLYFCRALALRVYLAHSVKRVMAFGGRGPLKEL